MKTCLPLPKKHILTSLDMPADNVTSSNTIALSVSLAPEEDWSRVG